MRLKISARKSDLARLQAYRVGSALKDKNPNLEIEYRFKESLGDINLTDPLWKIPEKGVFTEDFYGELVRGDADMVVHSWKDLPTELKSDTEIAATLPRADQRDLLLVKKSHLEKIKQNSELRIFSSSPRREYNLKNFLKEHLPFAVSEVNFQSVRGNIPTRIRKLLEASEVDGLIVAKAALDRLLSAPETEFAEVQGVLQSYLKELDWMVLPLTINPNAAAQGALAVEILSSRTDLKNILNEINHAETFRCALLERKHLASFGGGCHQKIGVAVLERPYGQITFLKGLTDAKVVLDAKTLAKEQTPSQYPADKLWCQEVVSLRTRLKDIKIPTKTNAFFVARSEAWPFNGDTLELNIRQNIQQNIQQNTQPSDQPNIQDKSPAADLNKDFTTKDLNLNHIVWTAGLKTWKALAQKGVWVHGSSEGLGENEHALLDTLAAPQFGKLNWVKFTHNQQFAENKSGLEVIPTYTLEITDDFSSCADKECFFWNSGSQFLSAIEALPWIVKKSHACGPGNTYKIIQQYLVEKNLFDSARLSVFLDQEDWRKQCTQI